MKLEDPSAVRLSFAEAGEVVFRKEFPAARRLGVDKTLISRYLKVKYLESAGFDTTKAQDDFAQTFSFLTGFDKSAPILNQGRSTRRYPYLSVLNLPDTGYGPF